MSVPGGSVAPHRVFIAIRVPGWQSALKRSPYKGKQMQDQQRSHIRISNDSQLRD
jgi:hypothetical protein